MICSDDRYLEYPFSALVRSDYTALQQYGRAKLEFRSENGAIPCRAGFNSVIGSLPCRFLGHSFLPLSPQRLELPASRTSLVCRKRQRHNPSHHRSEPRSRQVPFRQHQPVVPRMLHQPPVRLRVMEACCCWRWLSGKPTYTSEGR
jgi:hypothetical protein